MLSNQPLPEDESGRRLRNYDAFWVGLNHGSRGDFRAETVSQS